MAIAMSELSDAVLNGDAVKSVTLVSEAIASGVEPVAILENGLLPGVRELGRRFEAGDVFLPELLAGADAMKSATQLLWPQDAAHNRPSVGKCLLGTVEGDAHDIGKNLVAMMLQQHGWKVTDLGTDVPAHAFCEAIAEGEFDILGLSALLTTTMPVMGEIVEMLESSGLRKSVKVLIGGAPVTGEFAVSIGADAYAANAVDAVRVANGLIHRGL